MLAAIAVLGGAGVAERLAPYSADDPGTESVRAAALLEQAGISADVDAVAVVRTPAGAASTSGRARIATVASILRAEAEVTRVVTSGDAGRPLASRDGALSYVAAGFRVGSDEEAVAERLIARFDKETDVLLGGPAIAAVQVNEQTAHDLKRAEIMVFPLLFLLSLLFFRSVVAALLPLLVGAMSILMTMLGLRVGSEFGSISVFALNAVTGLGLGLAIDYSLFMVSRYREELARVGPGPEALRRTMATAGRTILYSSVTVAAALGALLIFPQRFLYSMGIGGMMVALLAAVIALTVLPAVLMLLGPRVNSLAPARLRRAAETEARNPQTGGWYRFSRAVMRRPGTIAAGTATLLIVTGLPFLSINFTAVDASILPSTASARQVDDVLRRDFDVRQTTPITLVAQDPQPAALETYLQDVRTTEGVTSVSKPRREGDSLAIVDVISNTPALTAESQQTLRAVRDLDPPFTVLARGQTAGLVDLKASLADHIPLALAIVVAATMIVLFLMTGSLLLPVKAILMNVLTLSATFGILVLVFQDGRFEELLGYTSQGALEATQPVFLFAVAFGLSTDYGVFLLARIKEARDRGLTNDEAVAIGLERTGRIVTAAAMLFAVAVAAFATSQIIFLKQLGIGTAVAVIIDATIIRALLVPSLMKLLGDRNWWAPRPLARLHKRIGLRETAAPAEGRAGG